MRRSRRALLSSKWAYVIEGLTYNRSRRSRPYTGMAAVPLNPGIESPRCCKSAFSVRSANNYPLAGRYVAKIAVPFLLKLGPQDNGRQLTVPIRGAND